MIKQPRSFDTQKKQGISKQKQIDEMSWDALTNDPSLPNGPYVPCDHGPCDSKGALAQTGWAQIIHRLSNGEIPLRAYRKGSKRTSVLSIPYR